ncbi:hypothetical protein P3W85_39550 [Cupriavidus basilensis]|uniref:Uncharacterized protein n=1 Tax=Cupriavidus basilensis TaxID=68895 RepID=A0ABT6B286_9BURK|nr:hypothetical protein [Cupriavidus basilensis]MDF3838990.1 hypothetical protein [Cupriavidus basilensis]
MTIRRERAARAGLSDAFLTACLPIAGIFFPARLRRAPDHGSAMFSGITLVSFLWEGGYILFGSIYGFVFCI